MNRKSSDALSDRLVRTVARTSITYGLLVPDDRILVAVSGGKDSYGLLYLLDKLRRRLPFSIELIAVHVSQGQPGGDYRPLETWMAQSDISFEVVEEDVYAVVRRNTAPGDTPCAVCSRMRRGILYTTAARLKCNKVALGHHREDTLSTFLMNLFYSGRLQAMPPLYTTDDGRFQVIRPLLEMAQDDLVALARQEGFPLVPCGRCSAQPDHKRRETEALLDTMQRDYPHVKNVMMGALKHVNPSHLLDRTVGRMTRPS